MLYEVITDAIGRWRTREDGGVVDAAGQLVDGTPVNGPSQLRGALVERSDQFVHTITEKLLTYALGRGVEAEDIV